MKNIALLNSNNSKEEVYKFLLNYKIKTKGENKSTFF